MPHITLRTSRNPSDRVEDIRDKQIAYLNVIEPGGYNFHQDAVPNVVFLRCESEEIEEIEYKPDYPFSRLHITLYEGKDSDFACKLLELLTSKEQRWHFRVPFTKPRKLIKNKIGSNASDGSLSITVAILFKEILGLEKVSYADQILDSANRLRLIQVILQKLNSYIISHEIIALPIESYYKTINPAAKQHDGYLDDSINNITLSDEQLELPFTVQKSRHSIKKPVIDAIYVTPPEYATDMAQCALEALGNDNFRIDFGDSSIGTGALYLAIKRQVEIENKLHNRKYSIESATGIDIDQGMAHEAYSRFGKRGLQVICGDAISPKVNLGSPRNLMLVNPPYNRHEEIPKEYRDAIRSIAKRQTGLDVSGDAGLFVYHLLIMDKWLVSGGIAVWLLPSSFLQSKYGDVIRRYLLNNVQLLRLHVYSETDEQFDNVYVSTTIVVFKKQLPVNSNNVRVSYGSSVAIPATEWLVERTALEQSLSNWRQLVLYNKTTQPDIQRNELSIKIGDLFDVKRGIATGANSFFVMTRSEAMIKGIPNLAVKPVLPKARYLNSLIVLSQQDGYPDVNPQLVLIDCKLGEDIIKENYPAFFEYLQSAKLQDAKGSSIVERALVKSRNPWYKQEEREVPPFLFTYMGRKKTNLPPLYFILNRSKALALNTYFLVYPKPFLGEYLKETPDAYEIVLDMLNKTAEEAISQRSRVYSGGLLKLEPNELKDITVSSIPEVIIKVYNAR